MIARLLTALSCFAAAGLLVFAYGKARPGYGWHDFLAGRSPIAAIPFTLAEKSPVPPEATSSLEKTDQEITTLIEAVTPAVVSVNTKKLQTTKYLVPDFNWGFRQQYSRYVVPGLGSGVIVSKDGYVLTNEHVIRDVDEIEIVMHDQTKALATLVGADPVVDIAILKIQGGKQTEFPCLPLTDSDKVKVGQQVWAIGNPYGLSETVTFGHISHRDRQISDGDLPKFQHDAVIEPGNSGGPLINVRGEVIGINQMIWNVRERGQASWQGISFAVPSNLARRAMERIMAADGKPNAGYLGLFLDTEIDRAARSRRVVVIGMPEGSPAAKAGLKQGDIITKFAGRAVTTSTEVLEFIAQWPVGEPVEIRVQRGDEEISLKPVVVDREKAISPDEQMAEEKDLKEQIGISVKDLTQSQRSRLGLAEKDPGIYIASVQADSSAEGHFLRGDIILQVNERNINSVQEFYDTLSQAKAKDRTFTVQIWRRGALIPPMRIELPE